MALKIVGVVLLVGMLAMCCSSSCKYGYQESGTVSEAVEAE